MIAILSFATALFAVVCGFNLLGIVDVDFSGFLPASTTSLQQQQQQQQNHHREQKQQQQTQPQPQPSPVVLEQYGGREPPEAEEGEQSSL